MSNTRTPEAYRAMAAKYLADKAVMEAKRDEAMTKDKWKYDLGIAAMADAARRHQDLAEQADKEGRL